MRADILESMVRAYQNVGFEITLDEGNVVCLARPKRSHATLVKLISEGDTVYLWGIPDFWTIGKYRYSGISVNWSESVNSIVKKIVKFDKWLGLR